MKSLFYVFAFSALMFGATGAQAGIDLTLNLDNVTLAPGGPGTMNIYVSSTSSFTLSDVNLGLQITPVGNPSALLQFSPLLSQPNPPFSDPTYVFAGNSNDQDSPIPYWLGLNSTNYTSDTINGGDSDDSAQGYVTIAALTPTLIGTVSFFDPGGSAGDEFQISVINSGLTELDDEGGNQLMVSFPSTGGLVTVTPSVVPEPSSFVITLTGLGSLLGAWGGRRLGKVARSVGERASRRHR